MEILLKQISLKNFKGIKDLTINFDEKLQMFTEKMEQGNQVFSIVFVGFYLIKIA